MILMSNPDLRLRFRFHFASIIIRTVYRKRNTQLLLFSGFYLRFFLYSPYYLSNMQVIRLFDRHNNRSSFIGHFLFLSFFLLWIYTRERSIRRIKFLVTIMAMQSKQKLERISSGSGRLPRKWWMRTQLFRSFSLAVPFFLPPCHPRRHGGINFLCRTKLNYQVFKRDRGWGRRGKIRARHGLQPAPNRARSFNSINYLNRHGLQIRRCHFYAHKRTATILPQSPSFRFFFFHWWYESPFDDVLM